MITSAVDHPQIKKHDAIHTHGHSHERIGKDYQLKTLIVAKKDTKMSTVDEKRAQAERAKQEHTSKCVLASKA